MLDVFANVEIEFGTVRGRLVADGQDFVLDVDEPSTLIGVVERRSLRALAERLTRAGSHSACAAATGCCSWPVAMPSPAF